MAIFPLRGCVIPLRTTWNKRGCLGVHLYQKDPRSVKKRLSYGYFPIERLGDSIENHMRQKGIVWRSFVLKRSKIRQEMPKLCLFSTWEVAWFHWEPQGTKGDPYGSHLYQKDLRSVKKWLSYNYFPTGRLGDSIDNHMGQKGTLWYSYTKKIQNTSRND